MKKILSIASFGLLCVIVFCGIAKLTDILIPKSQNRYYILSKHLEKNPEEGMCDVQVFGSCHAYTSFNPVYLKQQTGLDSFVFGNASEIIPTTYARMASQFRIHVPRVAVVETWGINPYETYIEQELIFGDYLSVNLECLPLSKEKCEVIMDFDDKGFKDISLISMNFPIVNYKDRLLDGTLTDVDFDYSFEKTEEYSTPYIFNEMTSRLSYRGFKINSSTALPEYEELQSHIGDNEYLDIEPDIVKYIEKIIKLCEKNDVKLIFYRAPYISTENELRKLGHLERICEENGVPFIDLEKAIQYNYDTDFFDNTHLSEIGANKSTDYLSHYIVEAFEDNGDKVGIP